MSLTPVLYILYVLYVTIRMSVRVYKLCFLSWLGWRALHMQSKAKPPPSPRQLNVSVGMKVGQVSHVR